MTSPRPPTLSAQNKQGAFIPYMLSFENTTDENQARTILARVRELIRVEGFRKAGITYSANDEQANTIINLYRKNNNNWAFSNNQGSNQGAVIGEIERLLQTKEFSDLQNSFVIFPIATMSYVRKDLDNPKVANQIVNRDLDFIEEHLQNGGAVLGWRNQLTAKNRYAVGGGVARNMPDNEKLSSNHLEQIQNSLNQFKLNYPYKPAPKQQNLAQGAKPKAQQPTKAPTGGKEVSADEIAQALQRYISRIESHKNQGGAINFSHGFWIFKKSRALNRQANYLLAKDLLQKVEKANHEHQPFSPTLFKNVKQLRKDIIHQNHLDANPNFVDRGINSHELKAILKMKP